MNRIVITVDNNKKIDFINSLKDKKSVIAFRNNFIINRLKYDNILFVEDFSNMIKYLDFQSKVNNTTLIILDCIRYRAYPNSVYTKIERLSSNVENIIVVNDFPFVFDYRNIYVSLKLIKAIKFHYKQWYDDSFYLDETQVNSLDFIYKKYKDYFLVDKNKIDYEIINWNHTEKEKGDYEDEKYKLIYKEKISKIKIMTCCQGFVNRMESKFNKLGEILKNKDNIIIITNWELAINEIKRRFCFFKNIHPTSYHQKQDKLKQLNIKEIIFFETIITQKIKFYDILKCYIDRKLYFFKNEKIGIDKMNCDQTINNLKELNLFYGKEWNDI